VGKLYFADHFSCKSVLKINGNQFMLFVFERRFNIFGFPFGHKISSSIYDCGSCLCDFVYGYFGRIFCGWICPQTIFLEMVLEGILDRRRSGRTN
jgi:polyferredoxin